MAGIVMIMFEKIETMDALLAHALTQQLHQKIAQQKPQQILITRQQHLLPQAR